MLVLDSVDQHSTRAKRRMLLFVQHTAENQGCHDIYNPYVFVGKSCQVKVLSYTFWRVSELQFRTQSWREKFQTSN